MLRPAILLVLLSASLAGCLGGGGGGEDDPDDGTIPTLVATDSTGVIRSVVFDEAIRPLANATVEVLRGSEVVDTKTTGDDGFAGFEGLAPGDYFVRASKAPFFHEVQQPVEVVAGVSDPAAVRLQLTARTGDLPFYQEYKIDAFMECSALVGNWCFIANYYPCYAMQQAGQPCTGNLTADNSFFNIPLPMGRAPDWLQGELVWQSTQAFFPYMSWRFDIQDETFLIVNASSARGASPLLNVYPTEWMEEHELGTTNGLAVEAFHSGNPAYCDPVPRTCNLGAAVEQRFTYILHVFYGYTPPEGWRFSTDGTVPPPT